MRKIDKDQRKVKQWGLVQLDVCQAAEQKIGSYLCFENTPAAYHSTCSYDLVSLSSHKCGDRNTHDDMPDEVRYQQVMVNWMILH